jgi:hypothetical protein
VTSRITTNPSAASTDATSNSHVACRRIALTLASPPRFAVGCSPDLPASLGMRRKAKTERWRSRDDQ